MIVDALHQGNVEAVPVVFPTRTRPAAAGTVDVVGLLEAFDFVGGDQDISCREPDAARGFSDR